MALTTKEVQPNSQYPDEIKGEVIGTVINNPDNVKEYFFISQKDYIPNWTYQDYVKANFKSALMV